MKLKIFLGITSMMLVLSQCSTKYEYPFQNPDLSFEERVDDLAGRMSLEEKVGQTRYDAPAIERLGIPEYNWWNECLHGVARAGKATVFPQAIGLAAMWDEEQMLKTARVISDEARAKHHQFASEGNRGIYQGLTFWSPNINIFRDPRWGRGMETYGEDPFLTNTTAVQFINGLQGDDPKYLKTVATSKHYVVHSGPEPARHSFDAVTTSRDFRDTYLEAFRMTVKDADVYSVMCAYNRYMGEACCGSDYLLNQLLRDELGFEGYVVSDCGAIRDIYQGHNIKETAPEAAALGIISGTDLNCGGTYPSLVEAVDQGLISEEQIDVAVKRLMLARMKLGMFDPPGMVPYTGLDTEIVASEEHKKIALETARKSMVLLKNDKGALPLNSSEGTYAVIGPNADDLEVLSGNYNGIPTNPVTPLQGIREKIGDENRVLYARGCNHAENLPYVEAIPDAYFFKDPGKTEKGLHASYFDNLDRSGEPVQSGTVSNIDFYWWDRAPLEALEDDTFSIRYEGYLVPPISGEYYIGTEAQNYSELYIDDSAIIKQGHVHHASKVYKKITLNAGEAYHIRCEMHNYHGDASVRLFWQVPGQDLFREALETARKADKIILFLGLSPRLEGEEMRVEVEGFEGGDRLSLDLPKVQQQLTRAIYAIGKPVILVLLNGSALSINWADQYIPAILEAWYPGEKAGEAIADVIFGDYNPAGRLPVTFYKSVKDLPPFEDYNMMERTYRYFGGPVLYPFGHGLSYTTYEYGKPILSGNEFTLNSGQLELRVDVSNTGELEGEEVVQLYLSQNDHSEVRPVKELKGYKRISLAAGETKSVSFEIDADLLEYYDTEKESYSVFPGMYTLMVGPSSDDRLLQKIEFTVKK